MPFLSYFCNEMNKWHDFFAMSRHERRGALALLAFLALVLVVTALFRWCAPAAHVNPTQADVEQFQQQIDSLQPAEPASKQHVKPKKRRLAPPKRSKPHHQQRRLEPVPQISAPNGHERYVFGD